MPNINMQKKDAEVVDRGMRGVVVSTISAHPYDIALFKISTHIKSES